MNGLVFPKKPIFFTKKHMHTRGRALYNLIRMNWLEDESLEVEPWQVEDYRALSTEELLSRLEGIGIPVDEERFKHYAEACSSPEELTDTLWVEEAEERFDEAYLLIFELWRRLLPEKQSLSIFCDQLDHLIDLYDEGKLDNEEKLHNALTELEHVLDAHSDQGEDPQSLFEEVSLYCAHDLESFIFDFASGEIDENLAMSASELLEGFAPYVHNEDWFEFLQLRLLALSDPEEAEVMLDRVLEEQKEQPDFELLLEIARYLVNQGDVNHFPKAIQQARSLIETEQDFQELLAISAEFYRLLDREEESEKMKEMLKSRAQKSLEQEIFPKDETLEAFFKLIEDLDRSEA